MTRNPESCVKHTQFARYPVLMASNWEGLENPRDRLNLLDWLFHLKKFPFGETVPPGHPRVRQKAKQIAHFARHERFVRE
jgi:hypothetical protein